MYEQDIYYKTMEYAKFIVDNKSTIRATAKYYGVAKSTVHYNLQNRLRFYDAELYYKVKQILEDNFNEKHIRGGLATRQKYLREKQADDFCDLNYYVN